VVLAVQLLALQGSINVRAKDSRRILAAVELMEYLMTRSLHPDYLTITAG
jgi:hypothetical protein